MSLLVVEVSLLPLMKPLPFGMPLAPAQERLQLRCAARHKGQMLAKVSLRHLCGLAMRTKTDGTDSVALARYGALIQPYPWEAPPVLIIKARNGEWHVA